MLPPHTTQHVHTHTQMAADKWGQTAAGMAISAFILTGTNSKVLLFRCSPIHLLDSTHQTQPSLGSTLTEMASSREDSHTRGNADTTLEALQFPPSRASPSRNTHTTHMRAHTNCTHAHRHTAHTHTDHVQASVPLHRCTCNVVWRRQLLVFQLIFPPLLLLLL